MPTTLHVLGGATRVQPIGLLGSRLASTAPIKSLHSVTKTLVRNQQANMDFAVKNAERGVKTTVIAPSILEMSKGDKKEIIGYKTASTRRDGTIHFKQQYEAHMSNPASKSLPLQIVCMNDEDI